MKINTLKPRRRCFQGFLRFIWDCFGRRQYARNANDKSSLSRLVVWWGFAGLGVLIFNYFPFKVMASVGLFGLMVGSLWDAIASANRAPWVAVMNGLLGAAGLHMHWHFGLAIFGYHFEHLVLWLYMFSGGMGILRRVWNALIWKWLDRSGYQGVV